MKHREEAPREMMCFRSTSFIVLLSSEFPYLANKFALLQFLNLAAIGGQSLSFLQAIVLLSLSLTKV